MELPIPLVLVFNLLLSPLIALAGVSNPLALGPARSSFLSVHAQQLIRALNFFPDSDADIIDGGDSSPVAAGNRIVEKRFTLHNVVGVSGVFVDDLGHHAGSFKIVHSHAARLG